MAEGDEETRRNRDIYIRHVEGNIIRQLHRILLVPEDRNDALRSLVMQKSETPNLSYIVWNTPGVIAVFLSEIFSIYPLLSSKNIDPDVSERVVNILVMFQKIAGDEICYRNLVEANICTYLFPFLHNMGCSGTLDSLRIAALGVLSCLLKQNVSEIAEYFIKIEVLPLLLKIVKEKSDVSRHLAMFILKLMMEQRSVVESICESRDKVAVIMKVLNSVLISVIENPSPRVEEMLVSAYNSLLGVNDMVFAVASAEFLSLSAEINTEQAISEPISGLLRALKCVD